MIKKLAILLGLMTAFLAIPGMTQDEPLPPQEAFKFQAEVRDGIIYGTWTLPDGYYLYRDKFNFKSLTTGVLLGESDIPPGEDKQDPLFGNVKVFHDKVTIKLPYSKTAGAGDTLKLQAGSQGCSETFGICYPPYTTQVSLLLPASAPISKPASEAKPLQKLGQLSQSLGLQEDNDYLPPDEAFKLSAFILSGVIIARWEIADGYYLYRDKFRINLIDAPSGVSLGEVVIPPGESKDDPTFGTVQVFHNAVEIKAPISGDLAGKTLQTQIQYQGCADAGLCYPPATKTLALTPGAPAQTTVVAGAPGTSTPAAKQVAPADENDFDRLIRTLKEGNIWIILSTALGLGLLLAFTACMYPMIPILSSIIVGQGDKATASHGFSLSFMYVQGMAITFGVIGAALAFFGEQLAIQAYMQHPIAIILFAALFIALALAMFGFYNIQMPSAFQSRLNSMSNQQKGGTYTGVFIMGALSGLIIGPCGGPFLIAVMTYAAASQDWLRGFGSMYALGFGMGLPLLVVGAAGGKLLPKAGTWMDTVKAVAGVVLLAVALYFLGRIPTVIPTLIVMIAWAALFMISGVYMGALDPLPSPASGWRRFWKGLGLVLIIYGVFVMLGGLTKTDNPFDPLHQSTLTSAPMNSAGGAGGSAQATATGVQFTKVKNIADLEAKMAAAKAAGQPVMLDFYADWCTYCKKYDAYVFPDPKVQQALQGVLLLKADVTKNDAEDTALMKHVGVFLPPAIIFYNANGVETGKRIIGDMDADQFVERVKQAYNR